MAFTPGEIYFISIYMGNDFGETVEHIFNALEDMTDEGYRELAESALGKLLEMTEEDYAGIVFEGTK